MKLLYTFLKDMQLSLSEDRFFDRRQLLTTLDRLRRDVARLRSPERIQPLAVQLGLVYPDPADIRTVTAAGVVVVKSNDDRWTEIKSILSASP